ncbi:glycosyltransferase [Halomonas sp. ATCH28]|uniref:Glycosyltransferase n=1 Tax=Halomonas gemina TaxID=2945105 RepID=A0ABT0T5X3_9GAMM|nr:glycosyltransferase [Halomonas gemina]MCL7942312.1 glycosyltransferase [Halomonas gemina]
MMDEGKYGKILRDKNVSVHCLGMKRGKLSIKGSRKLWMLIKDCKPDVVQTWMYHADLFGGIVARFSGVKNVCWGIRHSTLDFSNSSRSTIYVAKVCAKFSHCIPRKIICCAHKAAEAHTSLGYDNSKYEIIANGYDFSKLFPDPSIRESLRYALGVNSTAFLIGMVGRFCSDKDHNNLLESLSKLKARGVSFRCLLIGEGMDASNENLLSLINHNGIGEHVYCLGQRDDIPGIMNALDLHVLSSSSEAFPNVLAEAMACGTPCVSTDVGDAALIVGKTGWIVEPKNSTELCNAIVAASGERINQPDEWIRRRQAASERIRSKFSLDKMIMSFNEVWKCR